MQICKYTEMKRTCGHRYLLTENRYCRYRRKSQKISCGSLSTQRVLPLIVAGREYYWWIAVPVACLFNIDILKHVHIVYVKWSLPPRYAKECQPVCKSATAFHVADVNIYLCYSRFNRFLN